MQLLPHLICRVWGIEFVQGFVRIYDHLRTGRKCKCQHERAIAVSPTASTWPGFWSGCVRPYNKMASAERCLSPLRSKAEPKAIAESNDSRGFVLSMLIRVNLSAQQLCTFPGLRATQDASFNEQLFQVHQDRRFVVLAILPWAFRAWPIAKDAMLATEILQRSIQLARLDGMFPTMKAAAKIGSAVRTLAAVVWPKLLTVWTFVKLWHTSCEGTGLCLPTNLACSWLDADAHSRMHSGKQARNTSLGNTPTGRKKISWRRIQDPPSRSGTVAPRKLKCPSAYRAVQ